jgi:hypothetical protein
MNADKPRSSIFNFQFSIFNFQFSIPSPQRAALLAVVLFCWALPPVVGGHAVLAAEARKVLIPFDFVSRFDQGRYGRTVGEMIFKKLEREGGFILPETMLDVRDTCQTNNLHPSPELTLAEMKKIVREDFDAQIGIFGSVERVPGQEFEVYDLRIMCVDFTAYPNPRVIYQCHARTKSVSEIPNLYVGRMLDALYGRKPIPPPPVDLSAEKNWKQNPSLVAGDFQRGARGAPAGWAPGWEAGEVDQWEPLGKTVRWTPEDGNPTNRVVRFTLSQNLGDTTGVAYYSEYFPVQQGAKYRFQCRWRSDGPQVKVFIKCYDRIGRGTAEGGRGKADGGRRTAEGGRGRAEGGQSRAASRTGETAYVPGFGEVREVYRSQQNLKGPKSTWNTHTEDFTPTHSEYTPRFGRVMLYAYVGAGVVEFDDVVLKQIVPASPGEEHREPRHSLGSKVTVKEMEENERRSREAKEKRRREQRERQEE